MDILVAIEDLIVKDEIAIVYDITNQIENGMQERVESGNMPKHTFTIYVQDLKNEDIVDSYSSDSLSDGLLWGVKRAETHLSSIS